MISDYLILGGYGIFIWPAFIFNYACCLYLYLKTEKDLKVQEKIYFGTFKEIPATNNKIYVPKNASKEVFSRNYST